MFKPVKINFFQKSFDTKRRKFLFSWRQGNYLKYLRNRFQWYMFPNVKKVSPFPLHLDIEVAATCNMRCPMCASRFLSDEKYKQYGRMDVELFKRIVDEAADNHIFSIRLSWRGEVFTHPRFLELVHYAKVIKKIPQVSFLTNGALLKGERAEKLIEYGVDYISVSVDGLDKMYERIRKPLKFEALYENLRAFKESKRKMGKKRPLVRVTTLWPAIARNPDEFYQTMKEVSDFIVYNPLKDYSITTQDRVGFHICQFLYERLFIGFDGKVHPCSNTKDEFIIGDAVGQRIRDIWTGDTLNRLREMHRSGKRLEVFPCNRCSYGVDYEKRWKNNDWKDWNPDEPIEKEI
jgi:radical SAM protein with 4Fe4S-binding SPASM domain